MTIATTDSGSALAAAGSSAVADEAAPGGAAIRAGLAEVAGALALARQMLAEGSLVDLSGLDSRIDSLCRAILALPRAEGRTFESGLLGLSDDVARLNEALVQRHATRAADSAAVPREAAAAYRRSQS